MKTHTFAHGKYTICFGRVDGVTDVPGEPDEPFEMCIPDGGSFNAFHTAIHEALHADKCPGEYIHGNGVDNTRRVARFLWRWVNMHFDRKR